MQEIRAQWALYKVVIRYFYFKAACRFMKSWFQLVTFSLVICIFFIALLQSFTFISNYSQMDIQSHFTLTFKIIGSKHFLPHCHSRKCQSALAYSFIEFYSCPWLLPRRPSLSVHPATPFKEGYRSDYEKWLLKKPDVTHYLNIKGVWANNKFGLLIKVWKGEKLPSEVKCHCQSQHESLLTSKDISNESSQSIYGDTSVPVGLITIMWQAEIFFWNLLDNVWKLQHLSSIVSPYSLSLDAYSKWVLLCLCKHFLISPLVRAKYVTGDT